MQRLILTIENFQKSDDEVIKVLSESLSKNEITIDQSNNSTDKETLLEIAALTGRVEVVQFFLENKANPSRVNEFSGLSPLLMLMKQSWKGNYKNYIKILNLLKKFGADYNAVETLSGSSKRNALHLAIAYKSQDYTTIATLIANGTDINKGDINNQTPLAYADSKSRELSEFLIELNADYQPTGVVNFTPTRKRVKKNTVQDYMQMPGMYGETAAHLALKNGSDLTCLKVLLDMHFEGVNIQDEKGDTILHLLMRHPDVDGIVVQRCLELQSNPNLANKLGDTPLHDLIRNAQIQVPLKLDLIFMMLQYHAEVDCANQKEVRCWQLIAQDAELLSAMKKDTRFAGPMKPYLEQLDVASKVTPKLQAPGDFGTFKAAFNANTIAKPLLLSLQKNNKAMVTAWVNKLTAENVTDVVKYIADNNGSNCELFSLVKEKAESIQSQRKVV